MEKKHPKSSRPCFGNVPALVAPILKPPRPDRQRLGLSGVSVCPELPAISAALAVGTQGFSAVTE